MRSQKTQSLSAPPPPPPPCQQYAHQHWATAEIDAGRFPLYNRCCHTPEDLDELIKSMREMALAELSAGHDVQIMLGRAPETRQRSPPDEANRSVPSALENYSVTNTRYADVYLRTHNNQSNDFQSQESTGPVPVVRPPKPVRPPPRVPLAIGIDDTAASSQSILQRTHDNQSSVIQSQENACPVPPRYPTNMLHPEFAQSNSARWLELGIDNTAASSQSAPSTIVGPVNSPSVWL